MNNQIKTTTIQLIKYGIVGASNSIITLLVITGLTYLFNMNLYVADVIGYIAGVINSFIWNKQWVFKAHNGKLKKELLLFFIGFGICFVLQLISVWILMNFTAIKSINNFIISYDKMGEYIIVFIGMVIYTLTNYIYNRFITFKKEIL